MTKQPIIIGVDPAKPGSMRIGFSDGTVLTPEEFQKRRDDFFVEICRMRKEWLAAQEKLHKNCNCLYCQVTNPATGPSVIEQLEQRRKEGKQLLFIKKGRYV